MSRDLTPQEMVREIKKLYGSYGFTVGVCIEYCTDHKERWGITWWINREFIKTQRGRTLRSCLAKLKKEVRK